MTNPTNKRSDRVSSEKSWHTILLSLMIVVGLACIVGLARWMEMYRPMVNAETEEERLYLNASTAKRMSLSFNGLVADWYWMRSLQYVGRKVLNHQGTLQLDDLSPLNLRLLAPLLDMTITLDPQFMAAYEYGAVVLPAINDEDAITLLKKGIKANPSAWRLYYHLGYIYWQRGDYIKASETYDVGAKLPGAPKWMEAMRARMTAEGGSCATAREMYRRLYEQADDQQIKKMAGLRLSQIDSFDERDAIRRVLSDYVARTGRCTATWKEVVAPLRAARLRVDASGAPLDPADTPYVLTKNGCDVDLDPHSQVPYR